VQQGLRRRPETLPAINISSFYYLSECKFVPLLLLS